MTKIGIIDYGMGNLHSVQNALNFIGCETIISSNSDELAGTDGLILPGVGAFPDAIAALKNTGLVSFIFEQIKTKPMLGICLGMQLLFDKSYEFKECDGLGLIHGEVVRISECGLKIPHMGWNRLEFVNSSPLIDGLKPGSQVYFVHSYKAVVQSRENMLAITDYNQEVTAIVRNGNVYGCQFHPEKSGEIGLQILRNFRRIVDDNTSCN